LLFETLLIDYGALYDKLPISAFTWKTDVDQKELLPLEYLQLWSCLSYNIAIIKKSFLEGLRCQVFMKNRKLYPGEYMFTIDACHSDRNSLDVTLSENPEEHKSFNIIKLDNGQFCAQPNNRILWEHSSMVPLEKKKPYFKVCNIDYACEVEPKWSVSHSDEFFYQDKKEEMFEKENETLQLEKDKNINKP